MPPPCHRRAVATGSNGATQDSAWATQLIWKNWKHLSPSLICCMTEYSRCDDLTWERGRAPGRMMAPHHGNEGSFQGPCPRWAIAGYWEPRGTQWSGCLSVNPTCAQHRVQGTETRDLLHSLDPKREGHDFYLLAETGCSSRVNY